MPAFQWIAEHVPQFNLNLYFIIIHLIANKRLISQLNKSFLLANYFHHN